MKFGLTQTFQCSYLPEQAEQLIVLTDSHDPPLKEYSQLIQVGFRRSSGQIYRPHCPSCNACHSLRVPVTTFSPSKSQKRLINKNKKYSSRYVTSIDSFQAYYHLYESYISQRHQEGSMFPPSESDLANLISKSSDASIAYIEAYDNDKLIAVAITDIIYEQDSQASFSALYTFFDPTYESASLGTWMILQQLEHAKSQNNRYLYLGYQIDTCAKMSYKQKFLPHERFIDNKWVRIQK